MAKLQPLVFLGASTAFSEISEIVRDLNRIEERFDIIAILDDNVQMHGTVMQGVPVTGNLELVHQYPDAQFVFGIGSFRTRLLRLDILNRLNLPDERFVRLIHPNAKIYPGAMVGHGSVIHSGAVIGGDVTLESFSIVTFNSVIGAYSKIGRGAMVTSMVTVLTSVQIGACAFIGAGSCVSERIRIGPGAMVGIASVIFRDVDAGAFVLGNPARMLYRDKVPSSLMAGWEAKAPDI
jgi:sugar O-acyltransferase (sialic acid O-acetyltransferase NeuD family)